MNPMKTVIALLLALPGLVHAVTAVNPTGVNVRSTGVTTVFLTFQGTTGQQPADAFWCGDITVPANTPTATNPCVPGTLFGHLPARHNLATASGTGGFSNTTDIMTIPASVARRAYQDALAGKASQFFYVRRFVDSGGVSQFIAVTCRMAGGGARVPLALTNVEVNFVSDDGRKPVYIFAADQSPPPIQATIHYNGSGRLKGRWEVVRPGDLEPGFEDLLTEASLPVEQRARQRRYNLLGRFDVFLPPTGKKILPGPDVSRIPTHIEGPYKILLRIEASSDKEGNSNTVAGNVISGGVAGFPMPVLRYFVGGQRPPDSVFTLLAPADASILRKGQAVTLSWSAIDATTLYRLELQQADEKIFTALVKPSASSYTLPPFIDLAPGKTFRWRITASDADNSIIARSDWQRFRISD